MRTKTMRRSILPGAALLQFIVAKEKFNLARNLL